MTCGPYSENYVALYIEYKNTCFIVYKGCNLQYTQQGEKQKGTNDAKCIVWALSEFFIPS